MICQTYTPETVLLSAVATCAVTLSLTAYAITTKHDFTSVMSSFTGKYYFNLAAAMSIFWLILCVSLLNAFWIRSSPVNTFLAIVVGCIYCVYLMIDTQLVLGGGKRQLTLDNYVMGAAIIYMDIISLFLKILQILGDKKDKKWNLIFVWCWLSFLFRIFYVFLDIFEIILKSKTVSKPWFIFIRLGVSEVKKHY